MEMWKIYALLIGLAATMLSPLWIYMMIRLAVFAFYRGKALAQRFEQSETKQPQSKTNN